MSNAATPRFIRSTKMDPFSNLALEKLLMDAIADDEQLLFLWQNRHTVVIGRNQNPWKECRISELEESGGHLARRLSGGGAVYHDEGNLNFTFISPKKSYDVMQNLAVISEAVKSFGLAAVVSGRNDVEIDGAKFSGNAFFETNTACCHHGTLMVDVDTEKLSRYLQPDPRKLSARSIDSVKSRVVNLQDLNARISIASLGEALVSAFSEHYGQTACPLPNERIPHASALADETAFFASSTWKYGKTFCPSHHFSERYPWGSVDIQMKVIDGIVADAMVYSDALDASFAEHFASILKGQTYHEELCSSLLAKQTDRKDML